MFRRWAGTSDCTLARAAVSAHGCTAVQAFPLPVVLAYSWIGWAAGAALADCP